MNSTDPKNSANSTNSQLAAQPFWVDKRVVVTGGAGFLGANVVRELRERACRNIFVPRSRDYDLRTEEGVARMYKDAKSDVVIHLAAVVGGIGANQKYPGKFFYDNAIMGIQLIEEARKAGIEKFVCIGTICAYPECTPVPFKEENLWDGYPEETNAPYGLAKKMLLAQLQAYRQEYGFKGIYLLLVNLYGPHDNFDLESSHVIPALIRKCVEARRSGAREILAWGSGEVTREFLFVEDVARAIVLATEMYNKAEPVNLGSGEEIRIKDLAELIRELTRFTGRIRWDRTRPDGQPRRMLDTSRAKRDFRFETSTPLREGLTKTIEYYEKTFPG
ncbi:GDP-L-fucose synthase family protein [Candidatus Bipolaricaulota bacterium]